MLNKGTSDRVLIVENGERDYKDIIDCLPECFIPDEFRPEFNINVYKGLDRTYYRLGICDLLEVETKNSGLSLDSPDVYKRVKYGVERLAQLRKLFECHFIIVTKMPVRSLRDHFENLYSNHALDIEKVFDEEYSTLRRKLNANKLHPNGTVYRGEKIHIFIKPYYASDSEEKKIASENKDYKKPWKKKFKIVLDKFAPYAKE